MKDDWEKIAEALTEDQPALGRLRASSLEVLLRHAGQRRRGRARRGAWVQGAVFAVVVAATWTGYTAVARRSAPERVPPIVRLTDDQLLALPELDFVALVIDERGRAKAVVDPSL